MKLHYLTFALCLGLCSASLGCSSGDDDIMLGNDGNAGSSSAGTSNAGTASGGASSGGSSTSGGKTSSGGSASGGGASGGASHGGAAGSAGYQPCAGKACGDVCDVCDPNESACKPIPGSATCTALGQCTLARPDCSTPPECEAGTQYYEAGCSSVARPGGEAIAPLVPGCYTACGSTSAGIVAVPCAEGFYCTTAWYDPSANCAPDDPCIAACGASIELCLPYMQ